MKSKRILLEFILKGFLAFLATFFIFQIKLDFIEFYLYDLRVRFRPAPEDTQKIVLVTINKNTVQNLNRFPDLQDMSQFVERLNTLQPKAVLFDLKIQEFQGSPQQKKSFVENLKTQTNIYFLTDELALKGERNALRLPSPYETLKLVSGPKSSDTNNFAKDGVTRRFLIDYQEQKMIHLPLAEPPAVSLPLQGQFEFLGTQQAYINFRPPGSFLHFSFEEILQQKIASQDVQNKILIVGIDTQQSEQDYAMTPYSRESVGMKSAEVHANIIETILRNDSPRRVSPLFDFFFSFLLASITIYVVFSMKPTLGLLTLGLSLGSYLLITFLAFWLFQAWFALAQPLLTVFVCYYIFIPYRLIKENRQSWEIFQKHKLLQQVEELKTNFISMMSHDLKTPIARVQAMTELLEKNPQPLNQEQREALDHIKQANSDLLKFINSILKYGQIESEKLQLHLVSKDVNQLLLETLKKHEFHAKVKKIQILHELEPLFPIAVDADLFQQIIGNLLENAIKYSPEGTRILMTSEEIDSSLQIQIADQGPGIPEDELPHIFMKFFRSKNAKSSAVKGSGLGLYLAKYFTELHGGSLSVESIIGQGSTFTVRLPLKK